jgi:hypothetical protein
MSDPETQAAWAQARQQRMREREAQRRVLAAQLQAQLQAAQQDGDDEQRRWAEKQIQAYAQAARKAEQAAAEQVANLARQGLVARERVTPWQMNPLAPTRADPLGQGSSLQSGREVPWDLGEPLDLDDRETLVAMIARNQPVRGVAADPTEIGSLLQTLPLLVKRIEALETLLYDALVVYPCHRDDHEPYHRASRTPCSEQTGALANELLLGLGLSWWDLPRVAHVTPEGVRASCCKRDGRTGTWLRYGQFMNPELRPSSEDNFDNRQRRRRDFLAEQERGVLEGA